MSAAALDYARRGWHVLPLVPGQKEPLGKLAPHGWKSATTDSATITRWWAVAPLAGVGIACAASGLVALDIDPRHDGPDELHEIEARLGPLPETVCAVTGSGGAHLLFRHPGGALRSDLGHQLAPKVDPVTGEPLPCGVEVKARHYIAAPPSRHPNGRRYAWEVEPGEVELASLPERWLAAMRPSEQRTAPVALDGDDPLAEIEPAAYFRALTGRQPDSRGLVSCPMPEHRDEHPSCRVYPTASRGWCCYSHPGGPIGGGIYQLAGRLAGFAMPLRGDEFRAVKSALYDVFEQMAAPR